MNLGLDGRVALVTGASAGIGHAIAAALAAEGARVAVASRSQERIEAAAAQIGGTPFVHDAGDLDHAPALVEAVAAALGPVDILVTNAGGPPAGADALAFPHAAWEAAHRTLVLGPMALVEAAVPHMRARRWGRVLNVSSSSVREPIPNLVLSTAHRAGILGAFKTLARQLAAEGITFNTLVPGRIATRRLFELQGGQEAAERRAAEEIPAARLGTPEEMGAAAAFLCSEAASYVTGVALLVDGGLTRAT